MARSGRLDSDRCPTGIAIGAGAVMVVVVTLIAAAALPAVPGLSMLALSVGVFATMNGDGRAVTAVTALAWPVGNGFLLNDYGELSWHHQDAGFVVGLLIAASIGMVLNPFLAQLRDDRAMRPFNDLLAAALEPDGEPQAAQPPAQPEPQRNAQPTSGSST